MVCKSISPPGGGKLAAAVGCICSNSARVAKLVLNNFIYFNSFNLTLSPNSPTVLFISTVHDNINISSSIRRKSSCPTVMTVTLTSSYFCSIINKHKKKQYSCYYYSRLNPTIYKSAQSKITSHITIFNVRITLLFSYGSTFTEAYNLST